MFKGDKVYISPVTIQHAEAILEWENHLEGWAPRHEDEGYSLLDILQLIHELQDIRSAKQGRWMIMELKSDRLLGLVDLTDIDFDQSRAGVGVLIADKNDRGFGYAKEGLKLLEEVAKSYGIQRLTAEVLPGNHDSLKLFERSGYKRKGFSEQSYLEEDRYIHAVILEKWVNE